MGMSEADIGLTKSGDYNETGFANAHNESLLEELEMHSRGRR
jgi:hypothetical protein